MHPLNPDPYALRCAADIAPRLAAMARSTIPAPRPGCRRCLVALVIVEDDGDKASGIVESSGEELTTSKRSA